MNISTDPWVWLMAFIMLSLFSFLWKENPMFRIAENIYVGASAGFMIVQGFKNVMNMAVYPLTKQGKLIVLVPLILGILLYTRFNKRFAYLSRYAMAIPIGMGAGVALRALPSAQILSQLRATIVPLTSVNNILLVLGVVSTLAFFLFTTPQNNLTRTTSEIGKYYMLITFGLTFATTVFQHTGIYFGALNLLLGTWLGLLK